MQNSYQLVRVFDKKGVADGNQAAVFLSAYPVSLNQNELISLSADIHRDDGIATTCFTSEVSDGEYGVACFNNKSEIQCCGHGMIAAAKNIFLKNNVSKIIINKNISASQNLDKYGHDVIELSLPRELSQLQSIPDWTKTTITLKHEKIIPIKSASTKNDDGYLLLELTPVLSQKEFSGLELDIDKVCENTKRALVIIQFDKNTCELYMRYFAPLYGVVEDVATGSVMRFVGDYIEKQYQCIEFDVYQCSTGGGYMKIKCVNDNILITANASMESS